MPLLGGCTAPLAAGLDEPEANRIVVALDRAGVEATKEIDPTAEGRFRVIVARDDMARAMSAIHDEGLPRPRSTGVLEALGAGRLVPSEAAEHAQYAAGLAGELERTLSGLDGVTGARVHLSLPERDPLATSSRSTRATASVLVEHRGSSPPLSTEDVQRLVAGGAPGLEPADVSVVLVPKPAPLLAHGPELTRVGPFRVARASAGLLRTVLAIALGAILALACGMMVLAARVTRLRAGLAESPAPPPAGGPSQRPT